MGVYTRGTLQQSGFNHSVDIVRQRVPALAAGFRGTIDVLLRDTVTHPDPETAWTSSLLTCTGAPLEFSFSTLSDDIRYTVEVGGPNTLPGDRLDRIDTLSASLGWGEPCREVTIQLRSLQAAGTLRWGAWLGVRHGLEGGPPRYKVYAEVPLENGLAASGMIKEYLLSAPVLSGRDLPLVMLGKSPGSERCEFYFEIPKRGLDAHDLECVLAHVGLEDRREDLEELIFSCAFCRGSDCQSVFPNAQYGLSYSVLPCGVDPVFSLYAFASDFVGSDGFVRNQLLTAAYSRGWSLGMYFFITEPIARRFFSAAYHNMISFIVGKPPIAGLQVCLSPPPHELDDEE